MTGTALAPKQNNANNFAFDVSGKTGQVVLTVKASQLASGTLDFSGYNNQTIVFNVLDDLSVNSPIVYGWSVNNAPKTHMLWNFGGATEVDANTSFEGSLLAVNAFVNQNQNIEGTLIAKSWEDNGQELHFGDSGTFGGNLIVPTTQPVPEPAPFVALGLGAAALIRRKRQS